MPRRPDEPLACCCEPAGDLEREAKRRLSSCLPAELATLGATYGWGRELRELLPAVEAGGLAGEVGRRMSLTS